MTFDVEAILDKIGVDYVESGDRLMVCCPFHNDSNPSCGLWKVSGYFRCFACGEEGSIADFVAGVQGISVSEALRVVKGQNSLTDLEDSIGRMLDRKEVPFQYFKWSSFVRTFPKVIPNTRAWDYLEGRGLSAESIRRFSIRWGGDSGKYRHRVILPIRTPERKLLAYTGRAIYSEMVPKTKKNRSPHRTLFGLYELLKQVEQPQRLVVVEGEFDAIYLQQCGVPAVANMGTSPLTSEKIRLLRRYSRRQVILSYDWDSAGIAAMYGTDKRRGQVAELSRHLPVTVVRLPAGSDPAELSEEDVKRLYGKWRLENV